MVQLFTKSTKSGCPATLGAHNPSWRMEFLLSGALEGVLSCGYSCGNRLNKPLLFMVFFPGFCVRVDLLPVS